MCHLLCFALLLDIILSYFVSHEKFNHSLIFIFDVLGQGETPLHLISTLY